MFLHAHLSVTWYTKKLTKYNELLFITLYLSVTLYLCIQCMKYLICNLNYRGLHGKFVSQNICHASPRTRGPTYELPSQKVCCKLHKEGLSDPQRQHQQTDSDPVPQNNVYSTAGDPDRCGGSHRGVDKPDRPWWFGAGTNTDILHFKT